MDISFADYSEKRALVVEDNEVNMEVAEDYLKLSGMQVFEAFDGEEAIDVINKKGKDFFDIIFMDIQMPVKDGLEAAREIRKIGLNTPIIAMTANVFYEDIAASKNAGMNEHITKPIDVMDLYNMLKKYL